MNDEAAARIQQLEAHMAELERQVEQLNEVILDQGRLLEKVKGQLRRLTETVESQELQRIKDTNAKPPHYQ